MYLTDDEIQELYDYMMSQTLPGTTDQHIYNMYRQGNFSKEDKIRCIKHNYPNEIEEFINNKYSEIFGSNLNK